ncbi:MAG TPA: HIT domain-containing protein, partial [Nitrospiria bacterium]|nr:HIT domain-containing protein [Nitrospiria bacterium]
MNRESGCIFCRIASKEVGAKIVYEDEKIMALEDVNPQAPVHLLVIPKSHIPTLQDIGDKESGLMDTLFLVINRMAKDRGLSEKGY